MLRRASIYIWVVLVFAASELLAHHLGIRFASETLGTLYQYLDPVILRDDLLRGLYYLHAQPPLFNLFLGGVVGLFPETYAAVFSWLFGFMALGVLLGMAWLMRQLDIGDGVNAATCLLFAIAPGFPVYRHWLFYTLPVAFLLVGSAVALASYLKRPNPVALTAFLGLVVAVMLTRSVFHPLWLVAIAAVLLPFVPSRKRVVLACSVPFLIVNLLFLKNLVIVGSYSGSTWLGLSLTKRWPLSQKEVAELKADGRLPHYWGRRPFQEPSYYRAFGFFRDGDDVHPAIDALYKSNGEANFNHRDYVAISNALLAADRGLIFDFPRRYLRRVATSLMLFLQPGPNSVHFLVDYDFENVHRYRDLWTRLFLGGSIERPIRMLTPPPNVWLVLFPVVILVALTGRPRGLIAYMVLTVVWVTAVTNLIEIGENDRMRWEVEPFVAIFTAHAATRLLNRFRLFFRGLERA